MNGYLAKNLKTEPPLDVTLSNLKKIYSDMESSEHAGIVLQAIKQIDKLSEAVRVLGGYLSNEMTWRFPLSDGVFAEVKVQGPYTKSHVRRFAALFAAVAENYQADAAETALDAQARGEDGDIKS